MKKYPVIYLLILAMIFGTAPVLVVAAQLGALSSSLAAIVLAVVEG